SVIMKSSRTVHRAFLEPLKDKKRCAVFFGIFSGCFGFSLINVSSAYDLGGAGMTALLSYFVPLLILPGFVLWPLLYLGFSALDSWKWRAGFILSQALALASFLASPAEPVIRGITGAFLCAPFWTTYHISMVQNTTDHNRGFEVSLASLLSLLGNVCAIVV